MLIFVKVWLTPVNELNIFAKVSNVNISLIPPVANAGINFSQLVSLVQTSGADTKYDDVELVANTIAGILRPSNSSKAVVVGVGSLYPNPYWFPYFSLTPRNVLLHACAATL